MKFRKLYQI